MSQDDALLSLERHATSKIQAVEDILAIDTMGFRGEAVPSIASISKFTLITCEQGAEEGTMVLVDGGKILKCCPAARSAGTTIEVKNLFFNVAVRRKFQRSPAYDQAEIVKVVTLMSLANPAIRFRLIANGETQIATHAPSSDAFAEQLRERVADTLGRVYADECIDIDYADGDIALRGVIGKPIANRAQRSGQYLFINGRAVVSSLVSKAVAEGYGTALPPKRFPLFVLHLTIPGDTVDVNVHPQKREVRLRYAPNIQEVIIRAVELALQQGSCAAPAVDLPVDFLAADEEPAPFTSASYEAVTPAYTLTDDSDEEIPISLKPMPEAPWSRKTVTVSSEPQAAIAEVHPQASMHAVDLIEAPLPLEKPVPSVVACASGYFLCDANAAQAFDLDQSGACWIVVDQHAVHSRILFERLLKQEEEPLLQALLLPITVSVAGANADHLREHLATFERLGIRMHESGPDSFMVDAIAPHYSEAAVQTLVEDALEDLKAAQTTRRDEHERQGVYAAIASRMAIPQNRRLSPEEARALLQQLVSCDVTGYCPRGNRVAAAVTSEVIGRLF